MANEGIDVEEEAEKLWSELIDHMNVTTEHAHANSDCSEASHILEYAARVRAETEAAVTKREREKIQPLFEACVKFNHNILHKYIRVIGEEKVTLKFDEDEFLSAREKFLEALDTYESNDAGERGIK